MSLADDLDAVTRNVADELGPELWARMERAIAAMPHEAIEAGFVRPVGPAPDFTLPDLLGLPVALSEVLADGPALILFYRGSWCPYCRATLAAYEEIAPQVRVSGGRLLAIGPERPESGVEFRRIAKLSFDMLVDDGAAIAVRYGAALPMPDAMRAFYTELGQDISLWNAAGDWVIAVPAAFVVDRAGDVRWARGYPDFRSRPDPNDALRALESVA